MRSLLMTAVLCSTLFTAGCNAAEAPKPVTKIQKDQETSQCVLHSVEDAKRFQKENGLVVDGKVGKNTKALMAKKGCIWAPQVEKYDPKWKNNSLSNSLKKN